MKNRVQWRRNNNKVSYSIPRDLPLGPRQWHREKRSSCGMLVALLVAEVRPHPTPASQFDDGSAERGRKTELSRVILRFKTCVPVYIVMPFPRTGGNERRPGLGYPGMSRVLC